MHGRRQPTLGPAEDPGGALEAWVQSFSQNGRQVYATNPSSRADLHLAVVPKGERVRGLGVRLLLRPDDHVSNAVRVFRDPARQPASSSRAGHALSNRRVRSDKLSKVGREKSSAARPRVGSGAPGDDQKDDSTSVLFFVRYYMRLTGVHYWTANPRAADAIGALPRSVGPCQ